MTDAVQTHTLQDLLERAALESTYVGQKDPLVGRSVSHFRIVDRLHTVGIGVAYKAEDTTTKKIVGLKMLPRAMAGDEGRRQKVVRDMRALSGVLHPHLVHVLEAGVDEGVPFIAFELVEGTSLRSLMDKGALPVSEGARLAFEVLRGLARAHDVGVHHRGLTVESVLLTRDGEAKVIDFGIAKPPSQEEARDDVLAWGKLAWELLAAEPLPRGRRRPLVESRPGVPQQLAELVERAVSDDPAARPQDTRDIAAALGDHVRDPGAALQRPLAERAEGPPFSPALKKRLAIGGALVVVLVAAVAAFVLWPKTIVAPAIASIPIVSPDDAVQRGFAEAVAAFYDADPARAAAALSVVAGKTEGDAAGALASAVGGAAKDAALASKFAAGEGGGWFARAVALAHLDVAAPAQSQAERAVRDADQLIAEDGAPALPHVVKAAALLRLGRVEDAEAAARAALQTRPQDPALHVVLAEALLAQRKHEDARDAATVATKGRPADRSGWSTLLSSLSALRDEEARVRAVADAKQGGLAAKDTASVLLRHGIELSARGRAAAGAALVEEAAAKAEAAADRARAADAWVAALDLDRLHQATEREDAHLAQAQQLAVSLPEGDPVRARLSAAVLVAKAHRALAAGQTAAAEEAQLKLEELAAPAALIAGVRAGVLAAQSLKDAAYAEVDAAHPQDGPPLTRYQRPWAKGFVAGLAHDDEGVVKAAEQLAGASAACAAEPNPADAVCRLYVAQALVLSSEIAFARNQTGRVAEIGDELKRVLPDAEPDLPLVARFKDLSKRVVDEDRVVKKKSIVAKKKKRR